LDGLALPEEFPAVEFSVAPTGSGVDPMLIMIEPYANGCAQAENNQQS
jgi:hypothetical protein